MTVAEKPPKEKSARFYWYCERIDYYMSVTTGPANRQWRWRAYQSLLYFASRRKAALGTFGTYALGEDEGRMRRCRDSLKADGLTIQQAIDAYFEKIVPGDRWHREKGASVSLFSTAECQNRIKTLLAPTPSGIIPTIAGAHPDCPIPEPLPFWPQCPGVEQAVEDGVLSQQDVDLNLGWANLTTLVEDNSDGQSIPFGETYCDGRGRLWRLNVVDCEPEYLAERCEACEEHAAALSAESAAGMVERTRAADKTP